MELIIPSFPTGWSSESNVMSDINVLFKQLHLKSSDLTGGGDLHKLSQSSQSRCYSPQFAVEKMCFIKITVFVSQLRRQASTQDSFDPQACGEVSASVLPSSMLVTLTSFYVPCACVCVCLCVNACACVCTLSNRKKRLAQLYRQSVCFSLLWRIYSLNYFFYYKYYSQLAAMMQVNTALETQDDFQVGYFW